MASFADRGLILEGVAERGYVTTSKDNFFSSKNKKAPINKNAD